ncbi:MAG: alpha/beta fold hydrolase [Acidimicrobiia bacterium]
MAVEYVVDTVRQVRLEVLVAGEGGAEDVVLVPSAQRGAADFGELQRALADAGYRSFAVNPRGAGASTGPFDGLTQQDLVDDVALVITTLCRRPVHLVGHALGNIVCRAVASYRPELVRSIVVMPAGGHNLSAHPVDPKVTAAMARCHDYSLSDAERIEAMQIAFFAPGNDPSVWLDGWWPTGAVSQAALAADPELWWRAGHAPILIIQPLQDAMASREGGLETAAGIGERASYVEVDHCGHAILPEQPEAIAENVIAFLHAR